MAHEAEHVALALSDSDATGHGPPGASGVPLDPSKKILSPPWLLRPYS